MALEKAKSIIDEFMQDKQMDGLKLKMRVEAIQAEKEAYLAYARNIGVRNAMKKIEEENKPNFMDNLRHNLDNNPCKANHNYDKQFSNADNLVKQRIDGLPSKFNKKIQRFSK